MTAIAAYLRTGQHRPRRQSEAWPDRLAGVAAWFLDAAALIRATVLAPVAVFAVFAVLITAIAWRF